MSRLGISFADVAVAADELVTAGEQPTIEKIRDQLGKRGSYSTISKYLKDWREGRPVAKAGVIVPPDQVQAAVASVWEKLHHETEATIQAVKAEATEEVNAAKEAAATAIASLAALKAEHEALKNQHHALSAQKELLVIDHRQAQAEYQLLCERHEALEVRHQEMKQLYEQQVKRLEEKSHAEIERLKAHADNEVKLANQLADTLKTHYEDARVESMRQLDQLKVENQKCYEVIKHLEINNASLKKMLEAKTLMNEQANAHLRQAESLIKNQQAQWETLQDKHFVTGDIVTAFKALPMQVTNELQSALTEQVKMISDQVIKVIRAKHKEVEHE